MSEPASAVFQPPSLESEAEARADIDEAELLNEALLKLPPPPPPPPSTGGAEQQQQQQQKTDAAASTDNSDAEAASRRRALSARLTGIATPALPASCRVKWLGVAPAAGISGAASIRAPLDRLVREAARRRFAVGAARVSTLPLARLDLYQHGLGIAKEPSLSHLDAAAFFPIETVSYATMDTQMPRIFCFISVEIAARAPVNPTCHAFLCASVEACYRLVLAVTAAFNSAVNRSKAVRRRATATTTAVPAAASAGTTPAGYVSAKVDRSHRVVNLAFSGDYEEA